MGRQHDERDRARRRLTSVASSRQPMPPERESAEPEGADGHPEHDRPLWLVDEPSEPRNPPLWRTVWTSLRWSPGRVGVAALGLIAVLAISAAVVGAMRHKPQVIPVANLPPVASQAHAAPPAGEAPAQVVVSVAGRVAHPGLVQLPTGARVADALVAAGGAVDPADVMTLNIATKLADGDQILVLPQGQSGVSSAGVRSTGGGTVSGGAPASKVNLNSATAEQLDALPGVGPVTAAAIIKWRTENGKFASVDQLTEVSGIGTARVANLKDLVTV